MTGAHWRSNDAWGRFLHLHGLGAHPRWFEPLALRLASAGVEVAAPDLAGADGEIPPLGDLHARIEGALAAFESSGPLFLAGTSLGACLALVHAGTAPPGRHRGVVLFAPALHPTYLGPGEHASMLRDLCLGRRGRYPTPVTRGIPVCRSEARLQELRSDPLAHPDLDARSHLRAGLLVARAWRSLAGWRGSTHGPILALQGDEDFVVSARCNARVFRGRRHTTYVTIEGGRHDLPLEPEWGDLDRIVVTWLGRLAQGSTRN